MNPQEIKDELAITPFEPFVIVTASGDRYRVDHPELAIPTKRSLYVFERDADDEIEVKVRIAYSNITAIGPAERAA